MVLNISYDRIKGDGQDEKITDKFNKLSAGACFCRV